MVCSTYDNPGGHPPSADLLARIDPLVGTTHESRSDVVRRALEQYLYRLECERDAVIYAEQPPSDAELVLAADPNAWKGTPEW